MHHQFTALLNMLQFLTKNLCFNLNVFVRSRCLFSIKRRLKSWSVMFFGSDGFSLIHLKQLYSLFKEGKIIKLDVVTVNTYKNPVFMFAIQNNLKHHLWPPNPSNNFDVGVVVSFGKLISKEIIDCFPLGIINVHASLLPQYRGANPIFHSIKNGDSVTGITIMKIKPHKFDVGDIVMQETCEIGKNEVMPSLKTRLAKLGANCISRTINDLPQILEKSRPQDLNHVSNAPKVTKTISIVNWDKMTAIEVYNLYRALYGLYDLKTTWNSKSVKFKCILLNLDTPSSSYSADKLPPGSIEYCKKSSFLRVHCADGFLYVCSLQLKDKVYVAFEFYCGYLQQVTKKDWIFR